MMIMQAHAQAVHQDRWPYFAHLKPDSPYAQVFPDLVAPISSLCRAQISGKPGYPIAWLRLSTEQKGAIANLTFKLAGINSVPDQSFAEVCLLLQSGARLLIHTEHIRCITGTLAGRKTRLIDRAGIAVRTRGEERPPHRHTLHLA